MATYLDAILHHHRERASDDQRSLGGLIEVAAGCEQPRGFLDAIVATEGLAAITEIKRRSPSKGDLCADLDPATLAQSYERGGSTCLSVLTDGPHFGGSSNDLVAARKAVTLPALRKDFTVDLRDVCDARIMGADAVLLIAAALDDAELSDFHALAAELGLDALVETHDEVEVERALAIGATLVGVNQRDLVTFKVDQERAIRVGKAIPDGVVKVAESGVRGPEDAAALGAAGYDAVLVGESLVTSGDPEAAVRALVAPISAK